MTDNLILLEEIHNGNREAENEIIQNNMGLVAGIAKRYFNRGYDSEEIMQVGSVGLLKAVRKFDTSFNVQFSTYAVPMIIGEIKRFIRDDGIIKVSRTHKTNAMKARYAQEKLSQQLNRSPTIQEISEECGISGEELTEAMEATAPVESINRSPVSDDDDRELLEKFGAVEEESGIINRVSIKESMGILKQKEREVIVFRYFLGKTQSNISEIIGVSQVQVSRIEKSALKKLKEFMEG